MPVAPPPSTDPLVALADRCVQCGLCLPVCPTYARDRLEAESPRGRIAIARGLALGTIAPTAGGDAHLDHCLACRSCEAACPAGVEYGELLVLHRARQRDRKGVGWRQRGLQALAARPTWMSVLLRIYRWAFPWLPSAWRPLPRPPAAGHSPADTRSRSDRATAPSGPDRAGETARPTVALFAGCAGNTFEAPSRTALAALCTQLGYRVVAATGQTCCGTLHRHAGDARTAARLARRNSRAFAATDLVLTLASGCHEAVATTAPAVEDALQFLARHAGRLEWAPREECVALHLPCTQRNVVRSAPALRGLLAQVPRLRVIELTAGTGCCGAAGTAMLDDPARAAGYRQPLLEQLERSGATCLLSANLGCRLHLANGTQVPVVHPLEWLLDLARIKNPSGGAA